LTSTIKLWHHDGVRTTISIDDDALRLAKQYAANRSLALGKAISELLRRAFTMPRPTRTVNGLQVFDLPPDSPRVTMKRVQDLDANQK
jgi:hypothetical protein